MFKRGGAKEEDNRGEEKGGGVEKEVGGGQEGSGVDLRASEGGNALYGEECIGLLRELLSLSSESSALYFELYQAWEEAKIETMRLGGLIGACRFRNPELAGRLYERYMYLFRKYLRGE